MNELPDWTIVYSQQFNSTLVRHNGRWFAIGFQWGAGDDDEVFAHYPDLRVVALPTESPLKRDEIMYDVLADEWVQRWM